MCGAGARRAAHQQGMSATIAALHAAYREQVKHLPVLPREVLEDPDMDVETASALTDARSAQRADVASRVFGARLLTPREIAAATEGRSVYVGMIEHALGETYGVDRVTHVPNVGWFLDLPADLRDQVAYS
jgi:hypothetical protein